MLLEGQQHVRDRYKQHTVLPGAGQSLPARYLFCLYRLRHGTDEEPVRLPLRKVFQWATTAALAGQTVESARPCVRSAPASRPQLAQWSSFAAEATPPHPARERNRIEKPGVENELRSISADSLLGNFFDPQSLLNPCED